MMSKKLFVLFIFAAIAVSCEPKHPEGQGNKKESDANYVGQPVGNFSAEEWYPGGELGTSDNVAPGSYEDPTPAVERMGLEQAFNRGEAFFERNVTEHQPPFKGRGPASVRKSCLDCHPAYGHGQWRSRYNANGDSFGNGYLLVVYHENAANPNDGPYVAEVTGMPQTMAVAPFLSPIDEDKISISWHAVSAMESGLPMTFPDGEKYELIYPELFIPEDAFNTVPTPYETARKKGNKVGFRLESTIGIPGTGLIDAIPQEAIKAQYARESEHVELNPAFWDKNASDFAPTAFYHNWQKGKYGAGYDAEGKYYERDSYMGGKLLKKFTYAMTRGTLQDGAGSNAIWNITNVSRPDRPFLYTTVAWARAMSENPKVIAEIQRQGADSPYYVDVNKDGTVSKEEIAETVLALLSPTTNQFDNAYHNFEPEMSAEEFYDFMVWHRGLAMPRARNLHDPQVQKGKKLFNEMGCVACHRPSWKTGDDNYWSPALIEKKPLPRYANQTIWPYSDFIQHRLWMKNDIHGTWCRTTPLWGRGLSELNTGRADRLHDCRARNVVEAIMWHGYSKDSDAYKSAVKFYNLTKEERNAVVKFIDSI